MKRLISDPRKAKRSGNGKAICAGCREIVRLNLTPQAGHEQARHRPALVLSPAAYNGKTDLMICCPLTTQIKNYLFEVAIGGSTPSAVCQIS
jgi:mRNA-degrading endonuclease toxin of MazEF toxin-antitoxin module